MKFLTKNSIIADHWSKDFHGGWYAESLHLNIGESWPRNYIAYVIEGAKHAANNLSLKILVNDTERSNDAEVQLRVLAINLLDKADVRVFEENDIDLVLANSGQIEKLGYRISSSYNEWKIGDTTQYEREFTLVKL